jgi:5-methylcytosine-specific restriction endonuclease McrA
MNEKLKPSETSSIKRLYNCGEWTPARFRSFVVSALRTATRRWPPKYKALKEAYAGRKTNKKTNKLAMHYKCACCKKEFVAADVQVDHILPVVNTKTGFTTWEEYINNMFCEKENLQVLCKPCHSIKTQEEKDERKEYGKTKGQQEPAKPRAARKRAARAK